MDVQRRNYSESNTNWNSWRLFFELDWQKNRNKQIMGWFQEIKLQILELVVFYLKK